MFPWRIAISGRVYWWLRNLSQLAGMERNPLKGRFRWDSRIPMAIASGLEVLELGYSCIADMSHWDPDGSKGDLFLKVCNYKIL